MKWVVSVLTVLLAAGVYAAEPFPVELTKSRYAVKVRAQLDENVEIKKMLCRELNLELTQSGPPRGIKSGPYELEVFRRAERHLSSGPVPHLFLSMDERESLVRELLQAVPQVIANCRDNPGRRFVDFLPDSVRLAL